tara:strand:+ start:2445 stop:2963 length:519 start_codon:yes stop_codon:yes gene_type:complete
MKETLKKLKFGPKNLCIFVGFVLLCIGYFLPEWIENTASVNVNIPGEQPKYVQFGTNWGLWTECNVVNIKDGSAETVCKSSRSRTSGLIEITRVCSLLSLLLIFLLFISTSYAKNKSFTWSYIISILFTVATLFLLTVMTANNTGPYYGGSFGKATYISYVGFVFILISLKY